MTRPQAGAFKAFSAVCTHQGRIVAEVKGGTINCSRDGSRLRIAAARVADGPAAKPLPAVNVTVDGGAIRPGVSIVRPGHRMDVPTCATPW